MKEKEAGDSEAQIARMQSQMNTVKQQSTDKANAYEARVTKQINVDLWTGNKSLEIIERAEMVATKHY